MSKTVTRELEIINKLGLHARAAAKFVTTASKYASEVVVRRGEKEVNGKSIMGVMMLAAGKGAVLVVSASGEDAEQAVESLAALVSDRFGEDE